MRSRDRLPTLTVGSVVRVRIYLKLGLVKDENVLTSIASISGPF